LARTIDYVGMSPRWALAIFVIVFNSSKTTISPSTLDSMLSIGIIQRAMRRVFR